MEEKFDYYDVVGTLVPGMLVTTGSWVLLTWAGVTVTVPAIGDALAVVIFLGLAFFSGAVVQGMGGFAEPLFYKTWGGMPSSVIWSGTDSVLGESTIGRIRQALRTRLASISGQATPEANDSDLFQYARSLAVRYDLGRVHRFNALYAYHRNCLAGILMLLLLDAVIGVVVWYNSISTSSFVWSASALAALALLFWWRAKRRAYSYVREVLLMAEQAPVERGRPQQDE